MGFLNATNERNEHTTSHCILCGATIARGIPRPLEAICLICRAAILDRIFQSRRRRAANFPSQLRR
jgi:hypothetical protein